MKRPKHSSPYANRLALFRRPTKAAKVLALAAILAAASAPFFTSNARATNYYWDGTNNTGANAGDGISEGGTGPWDKTNTYWDTGTAGTDVIWADGNTAIFGGPGGTVTLGVPISALNLQFTTSGYSIASTSTNTLTFTGTGTGATSAIYANGTGGTNTFTGAIIFNGGTGTVGTITANTATDVINFSATSTITQTASGATGVTTAGLGTINYAGTAFAPGKFNINNAVFNSSGAVTIPSSGTYFGIDSATGATLNVTAGTFNASAVTTFVGAGTTATPLPGTVNLSGGTNTFAGLNVGNSFSGTGDSIGTVTFTGGTNTINGAIRLGSTDAGAGTININTGGRIIIGTTTGAITRGTGTSGSGGSATLNFNGGVLQYNAAPTTVPAIAANINIGIQDNGGTISTNGSNITIGAPLLHSGTATIDGGLIKAANAGTLTLTGVNTYNGPTVINGGGISFANAVGTTQTLSGIISGSGTLAENGAGVTILTGNNTYTGLTTAGASGTPGTTGILAVGTNSSTGTSSLGTGGLQFISNAIIASSGSGAVTINNVLTQSTLGSLTFGATQTYTGALNFTNTTAFAVGAASTPVRNFVVNVPTTLAAGLSNGPLSTTISGGGTFTLNGNSAGITGGAFTVTNTGGVFINNVLGASGTAPSVAVTGTGVIGGNGTIFGTLSLAAGTTLTPGPAGANSIGTLKTGALTLSSTTNLVFDLGTTAAGGSDLVAVTGNLTLGGNLTVNQQAGFGAGNYELFSYTGTLDKTTDTTTVTSPSGFNYTLDTTSVPNEVLLDVTAVPEPSTYLGGLLVVGALGWSLRGQFSRRAKA